MFRTRLISGLVLVVCALIFIMNGGYVLWAVSLALSLVGLMELYRVFGFHRTLLGFCGYGFMIFYYLLLLLSEHGIFAANWLLYLIVVMMFYLLVMRSEERR